jgi:hypothetical protein
LFQDVPILFLISFPELLRSDVICPRYQSGTYSKAYPFRCTSNKNAEL